MLGADMFVVCHPQSTGSLVELGELPPSTTSLKLYVCQLLYRPLRKLSQFDTWLPAVR